MLVQFMEIETIEIILIVDFCDLVYVFSIILTEIWLKIRS